MERTHLNSNWLYAGRQAGFTDKQLEFLLEWHNPPRELDDLL